MPGSGRSDLFGTGLLKQKPPLCMASMSWIMGLNVTRKMMGESVFLEYSPFDTKLRGRPLLGPNNGL